MNNNFIRTCSALVIHDLQATPYHPGHFCSTRTVLGLARIPRDSILRESAWQLTHMVASKVPGRNLVPPYSDLAVSIQRRLDSHQSCTGTCGVVLRLSSTEGLDSTLAARRMHIHRMLRSCPLVSWYVDLRRSFTANIRSTAP